MKPFIVVLFLILQLHSLSQTATEIYNEGLKLKTAGKAKEAIVKFNAALNANPVLFEARYELGWCYNDTKDYVKALTNLIMVRKEMQQYTKWNFEMGYAYIKNSKIDSARKYLNRTLELKPDYSGAMKQLFYADYLEDKYENALQKSINYEASENTTIKDSEYWYRKGFILNALKKFEDAIVSLNKAAELNSKNKNTFLELGFANTKLKKANEAINNFEKAITIDSSSHIGYNGIGEVYRDINKDYDKAIEWYNKSLTKKANERKACYGIAYCKNAKGNYNEALPYLETAIAQEPTYVAAYIEKGYSLYKLQKYNDAIAALNKGLELNDKSVNAYYYLTEIYILQKNKTKAMENLEKLKLQNANLGNKLQTKVNSL